MLTLKKVKEMVKAPAHTKRVPSPKVLLEEGRIFLRKEFEHGSHLTLYHNGYVWFSAGKRNTVFHIHDCRGDYAYGASKGKGEVIKEEYFENCEWHIRALFEGEQRVEESQLKCEGVGQTKVSVSYHAVAEDWGEMADSEMYRKSPGALVAGGRCLIGCILSRPSGDKKTMRCSRSKREVEKTNNKCFQRGGSKKGPPFYFRMNRRQVKCTRYL